MNRFQPGHCLWTERRVLSRRLPLLPLKGRGSHDYLNDAEQKILDWWFKSIDQGRLKLPLDQVFNLDLVPWVFGTSDFRLVVFSLMPAFL